MAKYRKKPVVIDAVQFKDDSQIIEEIGQMMGGTTVIDYEKPDEPILKIETLEGTMIASEGDYIIKGVNGEFYPCKPDIFEKTYEKAE
uniref:hypothetical protein n=1 Tax=uncultured Allobacillus sp. TaxID=1638025 RepID=UPI002592EF88|nr:hypothetical protein [uncultured Allobacillus sp.]